MISFVFKFTVYFSLSYVILSFPFKNRPIFYHIFEVSSPFTNDLYENVIDQIGDGLIKGKTYTKKLFTNARPPKEAIKEDIIHSKFSGIDKALRSVKETITNSKIEEQKIFYKKDIAKKKEEQLEEYLAEEEAALDGLLE